MHLWDTIKEWFPTSDARGLLLGDRLKAVHRVYAAGVYDAGVEAI
jgi:hypothetical protein